MRMTERKQVDLTRNFLVSLMEEQLEIQQHVAVELTNIPQISPCLLYTSPSPRD